MELDCRNPHNFLTYTHTPTPHAYYKGHAALTLLAFKWKKEKNFRNDHSRSSSSSSSGELQKRKLLQVILKQLFMLAMTSQAISEPHLLVRPAYGWEAGKSQREIKARKGMLKKALNSSSSSRIIYIYIYIVCVCVFWRDQSFCSVENYPVDRIR